jgi:integral membrane protein
VLFLAYLAAAVTAWRTEGWSRAVGVMALLVSIPPFGTVVFERWATRTGRLSDPARGTVTG